jgi:hypothetical protein
VSAERTQREFEFHASGRREVEARFDGGDTAYALLLDTITFATPPRTRRSTDPVRRSAPRTSGTES